ncbi:3-methyl-2-oxobutanoate hydroxymethyltransferase [Petrocella sp. FN5]|uniref:3-methyl-2-oxobutanoate hydroxymethyltransferase n=1 Tax=Petrocella sp. FN5 TaxID=3032002 RepID=UPI0023DA0C42|nr:3-methyl-2-oxobutanoate hydroxymethyltransferase [Petrocella sp. FN5]MDF1618508.1 3-methyl-2-oxobutanoate hydroxymethyltransferase [Petrocella sp. FN5]
MKRFSILDFKSAKGVKKLTLLTAYDYTMAKLLDQSGIDAILVGDSLGMVHQGYKNTLSVTMDHMIYHTTCVVRGTQHAMVISDMPFMSYHISSREAVANAGRLIKEGGAHAVKLEGGRDILPQVESILKAQIPVMGHIGLTPQSIHQLGGFKVQGHLPEEALKIIQDAKSLESLGVFAIVLEGIPEHLAQRISQELRIPTIGIGASVHCDGQILVSHDMLGMYTECSPKFVKHYANLGNLIQTAVKNYIRDVHQQFFPEPAHTYKEQNEVLNLSKQEVPNAD